jgi:hypothetical protein
MEAIVNLLLTLGADADCPGAPPKLHTPRLLLEESSYRTKFTLPPPPPTPPSTSDQDADETPTAPDRPPPGKSQEGGCGGGSEAAGARGKGRMEKGSEEGENEEEAIVRKLRTEAGSAEFFKAYLCAVSDMLAAPCCGSLPIRPVLPADFLEGK